MGNLLKERRDIIAWLEQQKIKNYKLVPDAQYGFVVDVCGDVYLTSRKVDKLRVKFNIVDGHFSCAGKKFTSLEGAPASVSGHFYCNNNRLTSLEWAPLSVGQDFYCNDNELTSLDFAPSSLGGSFYCYCNELTNLKGLPQSVGGQFFGRHNILLGSYQYITDFNELKTKLTSDKEKELLSLSLDSAKKTILQKI